MDEARSALVRIKAEGGKVVTSYKNYNTIVLYDNFSKLLHGVERTTHRLTLLITEELWQNNWDH